MDALNALKRKRTQLRKEFTSLANKIEKAGLSKEELVLFEVLTDTASNLFEIEGQISDLWCTAEDFDEKLYEEDQEKVLTYKIQWQKIKDLFNKLERTQSEASLLSVQSCKRRLPNLPKLDVIKYDGDAKSWLHFWGQFKKIHEDDDIDPTDKFQYLLQSMAPDSKARQLVESYPPSGENYSKAIEALKGRFARDDVLIETYVRGLLSLMQDKGGNKPLTSLYDSLQTHLQALETLGVAKDKYASMLFPMIESALPEEVLRAWHRSQQANRDLSSLMEFLRQEVESEERIRLSRNEPSTSMVEPKEPTACFVNMSKNQRKQDPGKQSVAQTSVCIWCDKSNHSAAECLKAVKMSLKDRTEFLKSKKACVICFKINHNAKKCRSYPKCLFCTKRHFTIMCSELAYHHENIDKGKQSESSNNLSCQLASRTTLLPTLTVKIVNGKKEVCVRALIDTGAQRSYISTDIVRKLNLKRPRKEVLSYCLFGELETEKKECQVFDIRVESIENNFFINMQVVEQNKICGFLPRLSSSVTLQQLRARGITLTDSTDAPDRVSLLIGSDFCGSLITSEFIQIDNNLTAVKTKLGWTVQGLLHESCSSVTNMVTSLHTANNFDISDLWTLESIGIRDPAEQVKRSERELEVLENFKNNININEEGRYQVCLPWRDVPNLQNNYDLAKKRLNSTTQRLTQLGKLKDYDDVFREWLQLNIIEKAPNQSIQGHYLPHHAVIKESSLTTKIRPVFDASARDRNGISLNSCLESGVNLLEQIPNLLINFRKHQIGVTADIAKAFLQISLIPEDREFLRFLWWSDLEADDRKLTTYRHRRVVFGVTSSPFLLIATINHHLDNCSEHLENTARKLKESFYVDNCVTSVDSEEELYKFVKESKDVMLDGKFDLRGWISSPIVLDENVEYTSILGVTWNVKLDCLKCNMNFDKTYEKLTKRSLLSVAQKVFDPIGIACATTIIPKMIMQKAWLRNLSWDQELPEDLAKEFRKWLEQVHYINECVIPRPLSSRPITQCDISLHIFCDASKDAYSACVFLRSQHVEHVNISLVLAKSRVTPVKIITVPRLELIAATLATRLSLTVINSLDLNNLKIYYWTDSSVVLAWIKGDGPWSVFVSNRVKEITSSSEASNWRHVPGNLNPADLPSRGVHPKGLVETRWWEGPTWLKLPEEEWPNVQLVPSLSEVNEERRKTGIHTLLVEENSFLSRLTYFSNYVKIVRMLCWMLRLRRKRTSRELTYDEFEYAETLLIKLIQQRYRELLLKDKRLQTFVDDDGMIRLNTKLDKSNENRNFKFPIVLPGSEAIIRRLVERRHIELQHAGVQTLLSNLRQHYWILGQRKLIRSVVDRCMRCKRYKAKRCQAPTGVLPVERMEANAAFEFSGVDLAGPLLLRNGAKAWIVLFTCATYRAVHLEVVESLSTGEFLMALRRFVARRGRVKCLFSDNATNFRGLDNALNSIDWLEIQRVSSITRIKWNFLPPAAPWWGGFYERLIGFLKQILRRVLGRASLSLIELQTVLCECESVINSRPLTYIGGEDDLRPLTPAMFIQPLTEVSVLDFDEIDINTVNARRRYILKVREDLRKRFRDEYIGSLIQRGKCKISTALQVGDIVLLETEDSRRITWPLGIIEELHTSSDGVSRVARVRTAGGTKVRPVQRLFPLELRRSDVPSSLAEKITTDTDDLGKKIRADTDDHKEKTKATRSGRSVKTPKYLVDFDCTTR